jgi:transcriptional regulator with XRE-family HTH domain
VTGFRNADSVGARIQALRKLRGLRTARDLADAIDSPNLTESVIENIEAGRKTDLPISQLLNIAYALQVPPSYLLVPLESSLERLDLPNLSDQLARMTPLEFDAWLSGATSGSFRSPTAAEYASRTELEAARELDALRLELHRIHTVISLESEIHATTTKTGADEWAPLGARQEEIGARVDFLQNYLRSAGWEL